MQADHLIFLSYASPDRERVIVLYQWLVDRGFNAWIDCRQIQPGQNWDFEINRAIDRATIILVFVSAASIGRRGYLQREIRRAVDRRLEHLVDDIFLIPILLDDVELPHDLRPVQAVSLVEEGSHGRIEAAISQQLARLGYELHRTQEQKGVTWKSRVVQEEWSGSAAYEFSLDLIEFGSSAYAHVDDVNACIRAEMTALVFDYRAMRLDDPKFWRSGTSTHEASFHTPHLRGSTLSVQYTAHRFYAGAAHGNFDFHTFNFVLDPLVRIVDLSVMFTNRDAGRAAVVRDVREQLIAVDLAEPGSQSVRLDTDYIDTALSDWSTFGSFVFGAAGVEVLFAPYAVAPYVMGPQFASLPYERLAPLLKPAYLRALDIAT